MLAAAFRAIGFFAANPAFAVDDLATEDLAAEGLVVEGLATAFLAPALAREPRADAAGFFTAERVAADLVAAGLRADVFVEAGAAASAFRTGAFFTAALTA